MVSWASDGLVAGYDPIAEKLKAGLYHFASPGSVDLGGTTRINYPMGAGLDPATYPNSLQVTAPFTFVTGDFTANPGKDLSAALFLCDSSSFPAGHIPTPSEILALGDSKVNVYRATRFVTSAQTITFDIPGWSSGLLWNTKYWVLLLPTALADPSSTWSVTNDVPMAGITVDTFGRALSLWANRTPAAPTITSPAQGAVIDPGATFRFTFQPNDPDAVTPPDDGNRFNRDLAGVQVQYAHLATVDNPTPQWIDLPFDVDVAPLGPWRIAAWQIRGSKFWNGLAGVPELEAMIANLGFDVVAGAGDKTTDIQPGKGALPSGDWQLRCRTFDYGHPYPSLCTDTSKPGPLGINLAVTQLLEPAVSTYPANNTSPWSDPVSITIPSQVPPPIPLSPVLDVAVPENETVRLSWQYRNTHQPPRDQYRRAVQIRKVGDPLWSTVFDGYTSATYVDLPPVITQTPLPPLQLLTDRGFEGGGVDSWAGVTSGGFTATLANVTSAPNAHSGSHYLAVTIAGHSEAVFSRDVTPPSAYENIVFDFWAYKDPAVGLDGLVFIYWKDAGGVEVPVDNPFDSPFTYVALLGNTVNGWNHLVVPAVHRPPGGVTFHAEIYMDGTVGSPPYTFRFDDASMVANGPALDNFSMLVSDEYEWRVQATDTDAVSGNYSTPARFWVVPAINSGAVRPDPSGTIEGATLGCGTNRAFIYRRGGLVRVGEIKNTSHIDWERKRDDISTAQVVVSGWDIDCGNLLSLLQPWAYELVIFRENGFSTERVWEGPIITLTYEADKVTIDAKDVMEYAYRRIIKQQMSDAGTNNGTTVVDRARRILQNVFAPDDPNILAYLQVLAHDDDAMQHRSTPAYSRTAFEEIDDMASNAGLDYTCVGRSILLWGTKHRIGTLPEFSDKDLGSSPIVSVYGGSFANRYAVSDGNGVWGEATRLTDGQDPIYGLVEILSSTWASDSQNQSGTFTAEGLQSTINSFEGFAERAIADRYPPPVVVRLPDNTTINPSTNISVQQLVPGVVIPLRSTGTLRSVVASQKLDSMKVVQEASGEKISITLSPFSRDDASATTDGG